MRKGWILAFLLLFVWCCARVMPILSCECVGCGKGEVCRPSGQLLGVTVCDCAPLEPKPPEVVFLAFPRQGFSPLWVRFHLELRGEAPLPQEWRCPKVVWYWPNDTQSVEEADCGEAPAPRSWTRRSPGAIELLAEQGEDIPFVVELWQGTKLLARKELTVRVLP